MAGKRITNQKAAYLASELTNSEPRRQKTALQDISRLHRSGFRFAPEVGVRIEQQIVALTSMSRDEKVVRWALNAIARLGTQDAVGSVEDALKRYEERPEIVAAGISAIARLRMGQIAGITALDGVPYEVQMLAAMQTVSPDRLKTNGLAINIARADVEVLKLALIVVGLDRDVQNLLHPRYENGVIVRELGQHDDHIVRQYSVWAVIENHRLTIDHLGIDLDRIEDESENVQAKLLQLGASTLTDLRQRQELIVRGSFLPSLDAREGLAKGLLHAYFDGLETVTLEWFDTDGSPRVRRLLAEHFARHSDYVPSYDDKALELAGQGGELREAVLLGAEGLALTSRIKKAEGTVRLDLFGPGGDDRMVELERTVKRMRRDTILILNATPDNLDRIRVDKEAALLEEQLEMVHHRERDMAVVAKFAVRIDQIQKEMLNHRPKVLHFSGHAERGILAFEDRDGKATILTGAVLADMVAAYGDLECVVLHACYTEEIARACAKHVRYVIGSTDSIGDGTAPKFTYAFYQALVNGRPYENAFLMGRNEVAAIDAQEAERYKFFVA